MPVNHQPFDFSQASKDWGIVMPNMKNANNRRGNTAVANRTEETVVVTDKTTPAVANNKRRIDVSTVTAGELPEDFNFSGRSNPLIDNPIFQEVELANKQWKADGGPVSKPRALTVVDDPQAISDATVYLRKSCTELGIGLRMSGIRPPAATEGYVLLPFRVTNKKKASKSKADAVATTTEPGDAEADNANVEL